MTTRLSLRSSAVTGGPLAQEEPATIPRARNTIRCLDIFSPGRIVARPSELHKTVVCRSSGDGRALRVGFLLLRKSLLFPEATTDLPSAAEPSSARRASASLLVSATLFAIMAMLARLVSRSIPGPQVALVRFC